MGNKKSIGSLGDGVKYVISENKLLEARRMKWEDAKMSKLYYYIANINHQCWPQYKIKMLELIQLHLFIPMSLGS